MLNNTGYWKQQNYLILKVKTNNLMLIEQENIKFAYKQIKSTKTWNKDY